MEHLLNACIKREKKITFCKNAITILDNHKK